MGRSTDRCDHPPRCHRAHRPHRRSRRVHDGAPDSLAPAPPVPMVGRSRDHREQPDGGSAEARVGGEARSGPHRLRARRGVEGSREDRLAIRSRRPVTELDRRPPRRDRVLALVGNPRRRDPHPRRAQQDQRAAHHPAVLAAPADQCPAPHWRRRFCIHYEWQDPVSGWSKAKRRSMPRRRKSMAAH